MSAADKTAVPARPGTAKDAGYRRPVPPPRPARSLSGYLRDPKSLNPALKQGARLTLVTARRPTSRAHCLSAGLSDLGSRR